MQEQKSSGIVAKLETTILTMQQNISVLETATARTECEAEDAASRWVMLYQEAAVESTVSLFCVHLNLHALNAVKVLEGSDRVQCTT